MKDFYFIVFLCGLFTVCFAAEFQNSSCLEKEKALTLLEIAESLLTKARISFPLCKNETNSTETSECSAKKPLAYIEISKKIISDVRQNFPICPKLVEKEDKVVQVERYSDCSEISANGHNASGIYTVWPRYTNKTSKPLKVYCDMETDNGGWTVIQRRGKFSVQQDFDQDWEAYNTGFGNITEEFWLGNENIRILCLKGCEIRFDLQDVNGGKAFANYQSFNLTGNKYRLGISGFSGNAGDGMAAQNSFNFSTKDHTEVESFRYLKGGWWYGTGIFNSDLNGMYKPGVSAEENMIWYSGWRSTQGLSGAEIKVRPKKA